MARILKNVVNAKNQSEFLFQKSYLIYIAVIILTQFPSSPAVQKLCRYIQFLSSVFCAFLKKATQKLFLVLIHLYLNVCKDYHSCTSRELVKHSTNILAIFLLHLDQSPARPVSSMVLYFLLIALVWKSMLSVCHLTTHNINHKEVPRALMLLQKYSI